MTQRDSREWSEATICGGVVGVVTGMIDRKSSRALNAPTLHIMNAEQTQISAPVTDWSKIPVE